MGTKFNDEQLRAVKSDKNSVILAGAGSGKTSVLVERFLFFIEEKKINIDSILALTFTKKAAAEMYERIYARLLESPVQHVRQQLESFDRAQISTIDSFCCQIVRNWSQYFGLPDDFTFDDGSSFSEKFSLGFILNNQDNPVLLELINALGFETVRFELFQSLAQKWFHLGQEYDFKAMFNSQLEFLKTSLDLPVNSLLSSCNGILGISGKSASIEERKAIALRILSFPLNESLEKPESTLNFLTGLKLTKPGGKANDEITLLKSLIDEIQDSIKCIIKILNTFLHKDTIEKTFNLLGEFQKAYNSVKQERGVVNFNDISNMAIITLLKNKGLRNYYKNKYRYIMIDEFQDNNKQQKELLFLLAEKKNLSGDQIPQAKDLENDKLFFVGDDKQSIYRFRGADVSVFKQLHHQLQESESVNITLDYNYRSSPGLIEFFNQLFGNLFADACESYEADFQALKPGLNLNSFISNIHFLYKPYNKDKDEDDFASGESEAYSIVNFIKEAVEKKSLMIPAEGALVPAAYSDFTILMRSTGSQIIYERMFRLLDIPYSSSSLRSLFMESPANDFYNLLQLAVYPHDRLSYAGFLRSPFINLSDDGLFQMLKVNAFPFTEEIELEEQDRIKYEAGKNLFESTRAGLDKKSLYSLLCSIWYESGYRYFILNTPQLHNFLEYFDYLAALADRFDRQGEGIVDFLDFIRPLLGKYEKEDDLDTLKKDTSGVQIMTIHKSKGLEFNIVVLTNTGNRGRNQDSKVPYYISDQYGLILNIGQTSYFQELAEQEEEKREIAELKRLLYVSLTRAKYHLIISGAHNRQNLRTSKTHLNMLLEKFNFFPKPESADGDFRGFALYSSLIPSLTVQEYRRHYKQRTRVFQKTAPAYENARIIKRGFIEKEFQVNLLNQLFAELDSSRKKTFLELESTPIDRLLETSEMKLAFGTLTHFIIEQSIKKNSEIRIPVFMQSKFPIDSCPIIIEQAKKLAANFLNSLVGKSLDKVLCVQPEYPFLYKYRTTIHGKPSVYFLKGVMDLWVEWEDKIQIIDFKTDRVFDPDDYLFQLGLYKLAAAALSSKPIECLLFPLRDIRPRQIVVDDLFIKQELDRILEMMMDQASG